MEISFDLFSLSLQKCKIKRHTLIYSDVQIIIIKSKLQLDSYSFRRIFVDMFVQTDVLLKVHPSVDQERTAVSCGKLFTLESRNRVVESFDKRQRKFDKRQRNSNIEKPTFNVFKIGNDIISLDHVVRKCH